MNILFQKKSAQLAVPHYHLLAVLLQEDTLLFRFDGLRVRVAGENLALLFERFSERRVWSLCEGRQARFTRSAETYVISHLRFHGTEIDQVDEGPVPREPGIDQFSEPEGLAAAPLLRFEKRGQGMRLALPANNLLQLMWDGRSVGMLFERWKVRLTGKGLPTLYRALRESRLPVVREGETMQDLYGKFSVEEIQFTEEEE